MSGRGGFLEEMARSSARRVEHALAAEPAARLEARARAAPPAPPLVLSPLGFDVIAELKLRSPAAGALAGDTHDARRRVEAYAHAGACAVSVLTEPSRFDGALEHLEAAARVLRPLGVPALRKDFILDPVQLLEARAAGAGGVLLILRMLSAARLTQLLARARELGLFVLLEAFDREDLARASACVASAADADGLRGGGGRGGGGGGDGGPGGGGDGGGGAGGGGGGGAALLVGINCRDLDTLEVVPGRFAELAPFLPPGACAVAESGVTGPEDACRMRALGYRAALIGTALMSAADPQVLLSRTLSAARSAVATGG